MDDVADKVQVVNASDWLEKLAMMLRPYFNDRDYRYPAKLRVNVGGVSTRVVNTLGVAYTRRTADGFKNVFISSRLDNEFQVAEILVHELLHCALPPKEGHGKLFRQGMRDLGLEGKPSATVAGPVLAAHLHKVLRELPKYPFKALSPMAPHQPNPKPKRATGRLKAVCHGCKTSLRFGPRTYELQRELIDTMTCSNVECSHYGEAFEVVDDEGSK